MTLGEKLCPLIPQLRRYCRALTGKKEHGDALVKLTLQAIVNNRNLLDRKIPLSIALYKALHRIFWNTGHVFQNYCNSNEFASDSLLQRLTRVSPFVRELILLKLLAAKSPSDIALVIDTDPSVVEELLSKGFEKVEDWNLASEPGEARSEYCSPSVPGRSSPKAEQRMPVLREL
jgi:DNA-directed RNA polymerase specialized sigma24 family protein